MEKVTYSLFRFKINDLLYWSSGNAFVSESGDHKFKSWLVKSDIVLQRLATAATHLGNELCCPGAMRRRWVTPTRHTLRRITASIIKDLICILNRSGVLEDTFEILGLEASSPQTNSTILCTVKIMLQNARNLSENF